MPVIDPVARACRRMLPPRVRSALSRLRHQGAAGRQGVAVSDLVSDEQHPERLAVLEFLHGRCIEIGCGHRKTLPTAVGVDLVPKGELGRVGNVTGMASQADIAADGVALPVRDGSFDCLVAEHNLEHYMDTIAALSEWKRVLTQGGRLVVVVPDEARYPGRTVDLDPTHFHAFDEGSLRRMVELVGLRVRSTTPVVPHWSFMLVAERID
jgi:SAM-dependent methyltransferase